MPVRQSRNIELFVVLLLLIGSLTMPVGYAAKPSFDVSKPRTLSATRVTELPVIDGKIDDACWKQATPITDFIVWNAGILAEYQSVGMVCYDDSQLYIAVKCLLPPGVKPGLEKGSSPKKKHDSYIFSDDLVEILLDPGHSLIDYYQIAVTAFGSTFDGLRRYGGAQLDSNWDGDWTAATHITEGYWSMEIAIPLYNLGITSETPEVWGINLCRNAWNPKGEQSTIAAKGAFHSPEDFAIVENLDVDFSNIQAQVTPGILSLEITPQGPTGKFSVPVKNAADTAKQYEIETWTSTDDTAGATDSRIVTLKPGAEKNIATERVELEQLAPNRNDLYLVTSSPELQKVKVSDAKSGLPLSVTNIPRPFFLEAARILVDDPWKKEMSPGKTSTIKLVVESKVAEKHRKNGKLTVALLAPQGNKVLAKKTLTNYSSKAAVKFPVSNIPWGAYKVRAVFTSANGQEILTTTAPATVLPGGKHQIKVLNNLVSELMDTKTRRLQGTRKIAFMNPRDGWVFFSATGDGNLTLDGQDEPLLAAHSANVPTEAMRYLPAGRYQLQTQKNVNRVIVRSIPELIYSNHPGDFEWDYLKEKVLPHCNTILGGDGDPAAIQEWTDSHKWWLGFSAAPGHGVGQETFLDARQYYEDRLSRTTGFSHPLLSGVLVDQISSCRSLQKIEIAKMLSSILEDPSLAGKQYRPWFEGCVFGSGPDMAFMRLVLDAGWPFAFYGYIPEKGTSEEVDEVIYKIFTKNALSCEEGVPGSMRRCIPQPGFMTYIPHGHNLNVNPGTSYKVLMQMQSETFANHPAFFGTYGQFWYYSPYVSEENLRWSAALFRHYGIEGKTTPLTTDPYLLDHIENPDFVSGTQGWAITEAEPGAVRIDSHPGYGGLQGRFISGSQGDQFLVLKRSTAGPNIFSQKIKNLVPGRMYSLKMITADFDHIKNEQSVDQKSTLSINIDNVEPSTLPDHMLDVSYPSHYGSTLGKFNVNHTAFMTYHWRVFRATDSTAMLTVSDWASPNDLGGPAGQEMMVNFIEIEPYFAE